MPNVTVTPSQSINVRVGPSSNPTVPAINYGGAGAQLRNLLDVDARDLQDGYGIIYSAAMDKFIIQQTVTFNVDGGTY
jgi:hypothetical protein